MLSMFIFQFVHAYMCAHACPCMRAVGRLAEERPDTNLLIIADTRTPIGPCDLLRTDRAHTAATGENTAEPHRVRGRATPSLEGGRRSRRPNWRIFSGFRLEGAAGRGQQERGIR